jgi:hypothetical protein
MRQIAAPAAGDMGIFIPMLCALPDSILGKQRLKAVKTCFCSLKHAKRCGEGTYTGPKRRKGLARGSIRTSGVAIGAHGIEGHGCNFSDEINGYVRDRTVTVLSALYATARKQARM